MNPTFRQAKIADANLIRDFQVAMALESENLRLDPAVCLKGVLGVFEVPARGEYWVLESSDGEVIGCTLLQREWSDWRARTVLWIHSLYVLPAHRGQGHYRRIYEKLQKRVKDDPTLGGLRLYVDRKNESAIRIYEKLGMTREHYALYEWLAPQN